MKGVAMTCAADPAVQVLPDSEFDRLAPEWDQLLTQSYDNRIFLTSVWHRIWRRHFASDEAYLVTARDADGALAGILPLQVERQDGKRILTLTGDFNVMDYMDALATQSQAPDTLRSLWDLALRELEWDQLSLRHVPSGSPLLDALEDVAGSMHFEAGQDEVCPIALLCSTWDGYLQTLSKKQRHEIRRKLRRAQEGVDWEWRRVKTMEDLDRDLPIFFRLHEASAREKQRFMTPIMRAYFRSLAEVMLEEGNLQLNVFRRDGEDIAATMSFVYRDRYLLYNSGYDPSQAAHSPGIAAVALSMQDAIEEKASAFDFLSGDEPYKYQFGASNTFTCKATVTRP
jgi:CelD/BcsL family acetyltransferase involved in cellulose biosynthesis